MDGLRSERPVLLGIVKSFPGILFFFPLQALLFFVYTSVPFAQRLALELLGYQVVPGHWIT